MTITRINEAATAAITVIESATAPQWSGEVTKDYFKRGFRKWWETSGKRSYGDAELCMREAWNEGARRSEEIVIKHLNDARDTAVSKAQKLTATTEENAQYKKALEEIKQRGEAYPVSVFPEPDFEKAHKLLQAGGMTLDAISASNMRRVASDLAGIAAAALSNGG